MKNDDKMGRIGEPQMTSRRKAIFFGMSAVLGLAPIGILIKDQMDQKEELIRSTSSFEVMCGIDCTLLLFCNVQNLRYLAFVKTVRRSRT